MEPATATLIAAGGMMLMQGVGAYMTGSASDEAGKMNKFLQNRQLMFQKEESRLNREQQAAQFDETATGRAAVTLGNLQPTINRRNTLQNMVRTFRA